VVRLMLSEGELGSERTAGEAFKIPEGVRGSIRRQLSSLPERTNSILEIAAVVGNEFESVLLEPICGDDAEKLDIQIEPAIKAGIVSRRSERKRFISIRARTHPRLNLW
jgi:hypothetical protein